MGANYQLGATIYLPTRPSSSQGCYVGNAQNVANGSHTYWAGNLEGEDLGFDQSFRDRLPLNCVPYPLMAAFCAWDGGRLETYAEHLAAYGASTYPWGNAPEGGGGFGATPIGPATSGFTNNLCPACSRTHLNWRNGYQFPAGGNAAKPWDYAYWMSPPGRFPLDSGVNGHKDMAGVMMELTATLNGTETMLDRNGVSVTQRLERPLSPLRASRTKATASLLGPSGAPLLFKPAFRLGTFGSHGASSRRPLGHRVCTPSHAWPFGLCRWCRRCRDRVLSAGCLCAVPARGTQRADRHWGLWCLLPRLQLRLLAL
jgi:hypothetical protein